MVKGTTRVWYAGLAVVLAALLVVAMSNAIAAGSKDDKKGYLGVYMQDLDKEVREGLDLEVKDGVLVSGVEDGGPAAEAGIEEGDVIVEFNGKKVDDPDDLRDLVRETEPGQEVKIVVVRNGKKKTIKLKVGEWPDDDLHWLSTGDIHVDKDSFKDIGSLVYAFTSKPRLGVEVTELNEDLASYFDTKAGTGVLVLGVNEESVADGAGIKAGDVITKVGDEEVSTAQELRESLDDYDEGDEVPIVVVRKGKDKTLTATMDESASPFCWNVAPQKWSHSFDGAPRMWKQHIRSPKIEMLTLDDDLREEIEELKKELKQMKKEFKELKK